MLFSIIIVTMNAESTLRETLESISEQTFRDYEVVAVDGASKDGTLDIFHSYEKQIRLSTLISESDSGIYNAMNKGIRAAKGRYLYFLNAQDTFYSNNVLALVADELKKSQADFLSGDIYFTNRNGYNESELLEKPNTRKSFKAALTGDFSLCHQAVFYKKSLLKRLNGYDESYSIYADWDCNLRALLLPEIRFHYIPEIIANFDLGGVSTRKILKKLPILVKERMRCMALNLKRNESGGKLTGSEEAGYIYESQTSIPIPKLFQRSYRKKWRSNILPCKFSFQKGSLSAPFESIDRIDYEPCGSWLLEEAAFAFRLEAPRVEICRMQMVSMVFCLPQNPQIRVRIFVNKHYIGILNYTFDNIVNSVEKDIPGEFLFWTADKINVIEFKTEGAVCPILHGLGNDVRTLGFGLATITLSPAEKRRASIIPRGFVFNFGAAENNIPSFFSGLYQPEDWGTWAKSFFYGSFILDDCSQDAKCRLVLNHTILRPGQMLQVSLRANNQLLLESSFSETGTSVFEFLIPSELLMTLNGYVELELISSGLLVPNEINPESHDVRRLGIGLVTFSVLE